MVKHQSVAEILKEPKKGILTDDGEPLNPYRWFVLVGLITVAILEVLDTTIVNVALPQMAGNLGASTEEIGWVATGYILSNVVVLPMTAWLAARFGRKRYLLTSIIIFLAASLFCGTATSLAELVFFRIIQGAGGAALLSTAQATIREIFPKEQQGMVQSLYLLGVIMAPTLGPTIGGWITDNYSWPWVFFVNLPIGVFAFSFVALFLSDPKRPKVSAPVDWTGIFLLAVGLGSLQYVLEEGNRYDWFEDTTIATLAAISAVALSVLLVWELWPGNKHPVVNLRVLKNRDLSASLVMFLALGFGLYGGIFIFPLFAQNILGFTPTITGLMLMPGGVATGVTALMSGKLLNGKNPLVSPRSIIAVGGCFFILSMWDLGHLTIQSGEPDTRWGLILRGAGLGMLFAPINLAAFSSLKLSEIPQGASLLNLMRQLGGSFGIAALSTFVTRKTAFHHSTLAENVSIGNPAYQKMQALLQQALQGGGYAPVNAQHTSMGMIDGIVFKQALTMAYNDAFLLIGISVVLVSPAVLLLRTPKKKTGPGPEIDMH